MVEYAPHSADFARSGLMPNRVHVTRGWREKMLHRVRMALAGAATLVVAGSVSAAPYIGVNFVGGSFGGTPTAMDPTDVAGVIAQANFNNVTGQSGTAVPLKDATGATTP